MVQSKIDWSQFHVKGHFCFDQGRHHRSFPEAKKKAHPTSGES